ncbi:MAG: TIGR00730 family Rossman fold protein [Acidobacteria bacterium]|nr:TIGR00730 family Rossman fold protein [Acidobacteriota bacterium]
MTDVPPKAYKNAAFLNSPDARTLRILAEYLEPRARFRREKVRDTIVFFGSARVFDRETALRRLEEANSPAARRAARRGLANSVYYEDARELARLLTTWSRSLSKSPARFVICSGGGPGIMEAANRGASEAGGRSIGLNISLPTEQFPNPYITPQLNFEFHYFFMRKYWFAYLAKALVIFPGGYGTCDELMEILTLVQTGKFSKKMLVLIYGRKYWDQVLKFGAMERWGMIDPSDRELFQHADTPQQAFHLISGWLTRHYPPDYPSADVI